MDRRLIKELKAFTFLIMVFASQQSFSSTYCSTSFDRTEKISIENTFFKHLTIDDDATAQIFKLESNDISISLDVYGEREKVVGNLNVDKVLYVELFGRSVICWKETKKEQESKALIVVDMQSSFSERDKNQNTLKNKKIVSSLNENILEAIELAKKKGAYIIFIEFEGYGETIAPLKKSVANYEKVEYFIKSTDGMLEKSNKSKNEIITFLVYNRINSLVFTGANGGACVFASIFDSLRYFEDVYALNSGIADFTEKDFQANYSYGDLFDKIRFADPPRVGNFADLDDLDDLKKLWK